MAQDLEDGEFWLPSNFLTDDDLLTDFNTDLLKTKGSNDFAHGFGGSSGSNSDLSSPVDSVMGSTQTGSDEDDFVVGLTRKIARTTFQDSNLFSDYKPKEWKPSTSPQSTICACKQESSPTRVTRGSSPPEAQDAGWDLLYTDAEEVARMHMIEETTLFRQTKLFAPPPKPIHVAVPTGKPTPNMGFHPTQAQSQAHIAYLRMQATHFQQMQMQQMMKRGVWEHVKIEPLYQNGKMTGETGRSRDLSMEAWPTLEQSRQQQQQHRQPGSGMRSVLLGKNGVRKERTGTGVFLPRTNPTETRKKTDFALKRRSNNNDMLAGSTKGKQ
ncbi:hypothetical protein OROGR_026688 [Orobanche gracilis]